MKPTVMWKRWFFFALLIFSAHSVFRLSNGYASGSYSANHKLIISVPSGHEQACGHIGPLFLKRQGPFGFGIFSSFECFERPAGVAHSNPSDAPKAKNLWKLELLRSETDLSLELSIPSPSGPRPQAELRVPVTNSELSSSQIFRDRKISWLAVLALLDQLPIVAEAHTELIGPTGKLGPGIDSRGADHLNSLRFELVRIQAAYNHERDFWDLTSGEAAARDPNKTTFAANTAGRSTNLAYLITELNLALNQLSARVSPNPFAPAKKVSPSKGQPFQERKAPKGDEVPKRLDVSAALSLGGFVIPELQTPSFDLHTALDVALVFPRTDALLVAEIKHLPYQIDVPNEANSTTETGELRFVEESLGLGVRYHLISPQAQRLTLSGTFAWTRQSVSAVDGVESFDNPTESGLLKSSMWVAYSSLSKHWDFSLKGGVTALLLHWQQQHGVELGVALRYRVLEARPHLREFGIGPFFRPSFYAIDRRFPADRPATESGAATQFNTLHLPIGVSIHVSF